MVRSRSALDIPASPALLQVVQSLPLLPLTTSNDLDPLLKRIGDARVVMLGEASHGTSEFYTWRAEITRRLVEEKGFNFVAVEGDFADCYRVNRYVKDLPKAAPDATAALNTFKRWPTWMWANAEARSFFEWMRAHNDRHPPVERVGFWGLDTYGLWDSLRELVAYFKDRDADAFEAAQACLSCFELTGDVLRDYARATVRMSHSCEQEAVDLLCRTREAALKVLASDQDGEEGSFIAQENARVVCDAEAYYRTVVRSSAQSWNVRDTHMANTLSKLLEHHGHGSKAVVWAHNTHVGDALFTDMRDRQKINIGQLGRQQLGAEQVVLVGFGTHCGEVIAGEAWGEPWQRMRVPAAREGSWEDVLHKATAGADALMIMPKDKPAEICSWRSNRAIGVVYRPQTEHLGNYVPTILPMRYDAFLFVDRTHAVRPLFPPELSEEPPGKVKEPPETFPSGM